MDLKSRVELLDALGKVVENEISAEKVPFYKVMQENSWFTKENVKHRLLELVSNALNSEMLGNWISEYDVKETKKNIAVIGAGNIPLVAIHDVLCSFCAGYNTQIKLSSSDTLLFKYLMSILIELEPSITRFIEVVGKISNFDAVIATGSNNSNRYFEQYFSGFPRILRKNRNSLAIIQPTDSKEEIARLGEDMFRYFGLGCRSVSKFYLHESLDMEDILSLWDTNESLADHTKFNNNYNYNKSALLVNGDFHYDTGYCLFKPDERLQSAIGMINFEPYSTIEQVEKICELNSENIQCIVGNHGFTNFEGVLFGESQGFNLSDFADNINTLSFLENL